MGELELDDGLGVFVGVADGARLPELGVGAGVKMGRSVGGDVDVKLCAHLRTPDPVASGGVVVRVELERRAGADGDVGAYGDVVFAIEGVVVAKERETGHLQAGLGVQAVCRAPFGEVPVQDEGAHQQRLLLRYLSGFWMSPVALSTGGGSSVAVQAVTATMTSAILLSCPPAARTAPNETGNSFAVGDSRARGCSSYMVGSFAAASRAWVCQPGSLQLEFDWPAYAFDCKQNPIWNHFCGQWHVLLDAPAKAAFGA